MTFRTLDVDALLEELTLEEKISLLGGKDFWHTQDIKRLSIPSVRVSDGPNGVRGTKFFDGTPSNCFTCGTGLAATFNKELLFEIGQLMGKEATLKGAHVILGPTCNILRSPVGGRSFESYSEDPVLSGHAAAQIINGIQSQDVLACIKHYVCNDQEDDRNGVDTIVTERALREIYLKPFQIAIRNSNPKLVMSSYNKVNGVHVSQSKKLLIDILRKEWGWNGATMSDWYGTYSIKESLDTQLNLEMPGPRRFRDVEVAAHKVNCNEISEETIDENVRQILHFINDAYKSGIPENAVERANDSQSAKNLLRKAGDEAIVLLKNENGILPLSKGTVAGQTKIAVIGPNARVCQDSGGGSASLNASYKITPYDGIVAKLKEGGNSVSLSYCLGADLDKTLPDVGHTLINEKGEVGITAKFYDKPSTDESRQLLLERTLNTSKLFLADFEDERVKGDLFYVEFVGTFTPEETGDYEFGCSTLGTAQVFVNGQLVVDNKTKQTKGSDFFLGLGTREERGSIHLEKGKNYEVLVDFGSGPTYSFQTQFDCKGGVYYGFRRKINPKDEITRAVKLAKSVDRVILVVGISKEWESEGFDRPNMDIPGHTDELVREVAKANKNVIVVNQSGSPVAMPWINDVSALVQAWYGGNETGNTIADVLFGDVNPSGKLSMTFPVKFEHNPSFLNFGSTNRQVLYGEDIHVGYRYYEKINREVLFPFGFGLSYTQFEVKGKKVSSDGENVYVEVDVVNTGKIRGSEVVQVYIQQQNPSVIRSNKELKDFAKVDLAPGEKKTAKVAISIKEATSYWNGLKNKWISEKDTYNVLVGNSSDNLSLAGSFTTTKTFYWLGL